MKKTICCLSAAGLMLASCASHYVVDSISRGRILMDKTYDSREDGDGEAFLAPYKATVDSVMCPVVGHAAEYLFAAKPESNLSNLLCDILIWAGEKYGEKPEVALYNMGGIRSALSAGVVTYGNVLDVAPFENKICFFDLKGSDLKEMFEQMASRGGEGVSRGVKLVMTPRLTLVSAQLNGQPIDPNRTYRLVTTDYLAEGNDGLKALKRKTNVNAPEGDGNNVRFIIMDYFREMEAQGKAVGAKVEGRITMTE